MKVLLDENISWRIIKFIEKYFEDVKHITSISTNRLSDFEIWRYAKINNYTILTYDSDFRNFVTYYNYPPKVVWIRTGNISKIHLAELIQNNIDSIIEFGNNDDFGILEIL
ncbi:MAG: DUF5615 family PIN-like protein [Candidatus Kapabacteria bacterium]|nr:DUF5615 family PIN-like protein [Ignavibacteriota bacterium]MCW5883610.1 DUF5615 family PIN-like protein [Candidatus Kapabacteria bacterium]